MKKYYLMMLLIFQLASVTKIYSQNIAINGTGSLPDTSAMLDVSSTNKGFLAPRMTTLQQNNIPLPAKGLLIFNTTDNGFKVNTGTAASPVWTALSVGSGTTTNTLTYSNNILTSTTNGVGASVNIINGVSNSSANNVLSTSVNGISGSGVSIINSNALSLSGTNLTSTINGVASGGVNLSSIVPATTNTLGSSANTMTNTTNGVAATAPIVNTNALALSGTTLTSTINGVASGGVNLSSIVPATTNTLGSSANTMTNTTNGIAATAPIVNTNALSLSGTTLTSTINGIASGGLNLTPVVAAATTNTLSSAVNTLTNTTNGVAATAPIINTNALALSGTTLTSTINGVASGGVNLSSIVPATTNTLGSSANTMTNTTNGIAATAPIVNTNALALSGTTLTSTINGIASGGVNLSSIVPATTNTLSSSTNTLTNTTNGVAATAPIVNTNVLALTGTNLTATINGIASNSINIASANTEPWYNVATNTSATSNTQNIYQSANVGIGVTDPATQLVVKDNIEIRRVAAVAQLLFSNTAGNGDFRFGGDGGDIYWQGGGGRSLQMGSYWATILGGDRQNASFPSFVNGVTGTSVIVQSMRDASVALGIQANSGNQTANLTEWRKSGGTVLSVIDKSGNLGIGKSNPGSAIDVKGTLRLSGSSSGYVGFAPPSVAGSTTYVLPSADGTSGQQLTTNGSGTLSWASAASSAGTVSTVSVATANGFSGNVATAGTTPVITLTTGVTGLLKGNGAAISAAIAGTDYLLPTGSAAGLTNFPTFNQNTTGNAATVTTNANLTGDVSSVGNATTIGASKVTNAMLAGSIDLTTKVIGIMPVANGGTGLSSAATGDMLYASAVNTWSKLAAGTNGYVLTLSGGVPTWAAANGGSGSGSSGWGLSGDASTDSASNFIGTTDAKPFNIRTNNSNRLTVNSATGFIGIATTTPSSTLDVEGSFGTNISKQTGAATLDNTATVWYFTSNNGTVTLPAASGAINRRYVIVNRYGSARAISSFVGISGGTINSLNSNSSVELISDGTNWLQIK
jgi:hypothetical protein